MKDPDEGIHRLPSDISNLLPLMNPTAYAQYLLELSLAGQIDGKIAIQTIGYDWKAAGYEFNYEPLTHRRRAITC